MAFLNPSEWPVAVQRGAATLAAIGGIVGAYIAVEAWAGEMITKSERKVITEIVTQQVRNEIDHSKMEQSQRIDTATTNISLIELQMENLEEDIAEREEEGQDPTERQKRKMDRLVRQLEVYESEQVQATEQLTKITRTTTTTTTESN